MLAQLTAEFERAVVTKADSLSASQVDLLVPSYTDNGGVQMIQSDFNLVPTSAGNNEFLITVQ